MFQNNPSQHVQLIAFLLFMQYLFIFPEFVFSFRKHHFLIKFDKQVDKLCRAYLFIDKRHFQLSRLSHNFVFKHPASILVIVLLVFCILLHVQYVDCSTS